MAAQLECFVNYNDIILFRPSMRFAIIMLSAFEVETQVPYIAETGIWCASESDRMSFTCDIGSVPSS